MDLNYVSLTCRKIWIRHRHTSSVQNSSTRLQRANTCHGFVEIRKPIFRQHTRVRDSSYRTPAGLDQNICANTAVPLSSPCFYAFDAQETTCNHQPEEAFSSGGFAQPDALDNDATFCQPMSMTLCRVASKRTRLSVIIYPEKRHLPHTSTPPHHEQQGVLSGGAARCADPQQQTPRHQSCVEW